MSAAASPTPRAPREGALEGTSVPRLLATAWRERTTGCLQLAQGRRERHVLVLDGSPIGAETGPREDDFARDLETAQLLTAADRLRVEKLAAERGCPQASAVLALKLLDAGALYKALRETQRRRIAETFEWRDGHYRWIELEAASARSARPFDLPALLQSQLPARWGAERIFEALMPESQHYAEIAPSFRRVARRLAAAGPVAARVIQRLDGSTRIGQILGECAGDPVAAATLWTLLETGLVRRHAERVRGTLDTELEIEVVVDERQSAAAREAGAGPQAAGPGARGSERGDAMRAEIATFLAEIDHLDHYGALGLEASARATEIKKAYFKAAKKYHPDALARLGLADLRDDAARVFARISSAFETLSDPSRRAAYDAGGAEEPEIDTARLAQAEKSFRKGEILARMGNFQAALDYLAPAVELWPDEPAYQALLGWAFYKQPRSDPERARSHLEVAARQAPDDALVLFRLGVVLRALGEGEAAERSIARARTLDPSIED